ncbi:MAG: transcription-repair coupling factor [Clostridia bacterium]|nr:transcription-repair coupling factor [Clostridia bacterium]
MTDFASILNGMSEFNSCIEDLHKGKTPIHITGMTGSQKCHFIYSLCKQSGKKCLVITYDETEAGRISHDLSFLFSREAVVFKNRDYIFYSVDASNHAGEYSRIKAISEFTKGAPLVAGYEAVSRFTIPPEVFKSNTFNLCVGDTLSINDFISKLSSIGYRRTSMVEDVGQYAQRGSIIDVFSPLHSRPVRIDLFDDEIDSLREFDKYSQTSVDNVESFSICPVREIIYDAKKAEEVSRSIRLMKNENLMADAEKFSQNGHFSSVDKYMPFIYDSLYTILDYATEDTLVFIDEAKMLSESMKLSSKQQNEIISDMLSKGIFPKTKSPYLLDYSALILKLEKLPFVSVSALSHSCPSFSPKSLVGITAKTLQSYNGKSEFLIDDIKFWKKNSYKIIVLLDSDIKIKNMYNLLQENELDSTITDDISSAKHGCICLIKGSLGRGFEYPLLKTVVIGDGETSSRAPVKRMKQGKNSTDVIKSFDDLKKGDYVVHRTHGVGQYVGIHQLVIDNLTKDFLKIKYKGEDVLYVPTSQLDFLHKFTGSESERVKLNSLDGSAWKKTVSRVKESVSKLAENLISLYAERSRLNGHVFSEDTPWQKEFEEKFIYDETPDQLRCIKEVKSDMEKGKCMDRLLCGDVGYGKTEVAIRAAFKCVMEGMQVAYLCPTTILAQQHYNTFSSRMGEYAMSVEMLSRFRTKKQQEKTISKLKSGSVDVVIGTHRLLQKDVSFKNLGLLIVDEEQRFGVGHKEKIKELKKNVNVLTLSATPIPRTLNMAMVGIRDLSVLSAPPSDRHPVQTFVMEHDEALIINAIKRELDRKGQVYYLHNRIDGIERVAAKIKETLPDARVAVAHGKMSENQLEEIMMHLLQGEIDVLVCTTIIETGLDVSNVNTIIIENADHLGLSQLYQLRGRVGRSNRLAYAYLTYNGGKILDATAHKRLMAIKEFTEFGSGFKIAMRDLEIRGAGNLLGHEQHGNMNLVGYDMYCMLLEQAVKEKKGENYVPPLEITVDIKIDAFIPEKYVEYEQQRIDMYKKIATIENMEDYYDIQGEFIDRFGDIPKSVHNLLELAYIKSLCRKAEISDVIQNDASVSFIFTERADPQAVIKLLEEHSRDMRFVNGAKSKIIYKCKDNFLDNIKIILQSLVKTIQDHN